MSVKELIAAADGGALQSKERWAGSSCCGRAVVLIVDDDLASRELLANYLEPEGYDVVLASSGTQAIEEAQKSLPDLIVTDVLMPGPGGLQTLFVLKNTPETSEIPAIVVSGINPRILGLMPAAAYLQKPVEKQKFVQTVRNCLDAALHKSI